jgi:hypothetical protein
MTDTKIKTSPCAFSPPKILLVMDQNNELQLSMTNQPVSTPLLLGYMPLLLLQHHQQSVVL